MAAAAETARTKTPSPSPAARGSSLSRWLAVVLVAVVALTLRVGFITETRDKAIFDPTPPGLDMDIHWRAAAALNSGADHSEFQYELMLPSAPLQVHWLAFWQRQLGAESMHAHRLLSALLSTLTAALITALVLRLTGSLPAALFAGLLWAMLPSTIFFGSSLHKSSLSQFLLTASLALATCRPQRLRLATVQAALVGMLLAFLVLLQQSTLPYALILIAFLAVDADAAGARSRLPAVVCLLVMAAGSMAFSGRSGDGIDQWYWPQKGIHMRIGFQPESSGAYSAYRDIDPMPYGHVFQARLYAEDVRGTATDPVQADQLLLAETADFITGQPNLAVALLFSKLGLFFNDFEPKGVEYLPQLQSHSSILRHSPAGFGLLVILAGLGGWALLRDRQYAMAGLLLGLVAAVLAASLLSFVTWRYRLPAVVPLSVLAGFGVSEALSQIQTLRRSRFRDPDSWSALVPALVVIMALALLAYRPVLRTERAAYAEAATSNAESAEHARRTRAELASIQDPMVRGKRLLGIHHYTEARKDLTLGHACPREAEACQGLLTLMIWSGDYQTAAELMAPLFRNATPFYVDVGEGLALPERRIFNRFIAPEVETMVAPNQAAD